MFHKKITEQQTLKLRNAKGIILESLSVKVSPLISAHAEAAIPFNLGKRIFQNIAREIRKRT